MRVCEDSQITSLPKFQLLSPKLAGVDVLLVANLIKESRTIWKTQVQDQICAKGEKFKYLYDQLTNKPCYYCLKEKEEKD